MSFNLRPWLRQWLNFWLSKQVGLDIAGLDLNDTCKRLITNLKMHFCQWRNPTNAHNPESNYTVIKPPHNGNSKAKNI